MLFWLLRYPRYAFFALFSVHSCSVRGHQVKLALPHKLRFPYYTGACSQRNGWLPLVSPSVALFISFTCSHPSEEWPGARSEHSNHVSLIYVGQRLLRSTSLPLCCPCRSSASPLQCLGRQRRTPTPSLQLKTS